jgi:cell division protein FtsZ
LRKQVDSLIVINNNKLREVYGNLGFKAGFSKADEVLATASRGIAEVITHHYTQNIDLRDAKTVWLIAELRSWDLCFFRRK